MSKEHCLIRGVVESSDSLSLDDKDDREILIKKLENALLLKNKLAFDIHSYEIDTTEEVSACGVSEAMFLFLPWGKLDVTVVCAPQSDHYRVTDNQTDFQYKVTCKG